MHQSVTDTDNEESLIADMNKDWFANNCTLKSMWSDAATVCNLSQVINSPTKISINCGGSITSTCIDHIFLLWLKKKYSKAVSVPVGLSDHNTIALPIKTKVPRAGPEVIHKKIYKPFPENDFYFWCGKYTVGKCTWETACRTCTGLLFKNFLLCVTNMFASRSSLLDHLKPLGWTMNWETVWQKGDLLKKVCYCFW